MDFVVGLSVRDPQHDHIEDFQIFFQKFTKNYFFWNFQNFQIFSENIFGSFSEKVGNFFEHQGRCKKSLRIECDHSQPLKITLQLVKVLWGPKCLPKGAPSAPQAWI